LRAQGPRLSLTIGAVDSLNVFVLPQLYRNLHAQHPSLKIEIETLHSAEMYEKIDKRQLDIAFSLQERSLANVDAELFFSSPMVVLSLMPASAGKHRKTGKVHPGDLPAEEELYVQWGRHFDVWHDQWWNPLTPSRIKLDSGHLILSMLQNTRQWAIVPLWLAKAASKHGRYMIRELSDSPPDYRCYKLTHKQAATSTSRAIAILLDECKEMFGAGAGRLYLG
jgi:DNA-binding transcriptional LysR family regulator